jgi:hypothetical protein
MAPNAPIWTFVFVLGPKGTALYRYFVVSRDPKGKDVVCALPLANGDMVAMNGAFQSEYYHGVPAVRRKEFEKQGRVSVTIRHWLEMDVSPEPPTKKPRLAIN